MNIFDWENYINRYNDLKVACVNTKEKAWNHWINYGEKEGRICNLCYLDIDYIIFDWEQYVSNYMDLQQNGINTKEKAWNHWINCGKKEGRHFLKIPNLFLLENNNVFKYKISVILVLHNNTNWFNYLITKLKKISEKYNIEFEYMIYENNSSEEFKLLLKQFIENNNGKLLSENTNDIKYDSIISKERGKHMNYIRNRNKSNHGDLNSNFTLLIDSDVYFNDSVIILLINHLINNKNISMISGYVLDRKYHYYDSLAFSTNKYNYTHILNTCLLEKCVTCELYRNENNIFIDPNDLIKDGEIVKVNSFFGSLAMVPSNIYNKVFWNTNYGLEETDHYGFCQELKKYGELVLDTNIKYVKHKNNKILTNEKYYNLENSFL
jgi:hypothetical protein